MKLYSGCIAKKFGTTFILGQLLSVPTVVAAHDPALMEELPTILSATRLPQPMLHSPVSATVIDREMISMSGFTHIGDLFRLVPGFQVAMATGGHYVVTYHGQEITFPMRIEVLVDGRSVYDNLLSSIKWNAIGIELEDIEQIEVIRGPNAPVFGSNALVATVNISTRAPYEEHGTWVNAIAGSQSTRKFHLRHTESYGKLDYSVSLGYREDDGFDGEPMEALYFDSSRLTNVRLHGNYQLNVTDSLDFQLGYTGGDGPTHMARTVFPLVTHEDDLKSHFQKIRFSRNNERSESSLQFYYNHLDQSDKFTSPLLSQLLGSPTEPQPTVFGRPDQPLRFPYAHGKSERADIEFQQLFKKLDWGRWVWGAGARYDVLASEHMYPLKSADNTSARLFTNLEFTPLDKLQINLGGMMEHNDLVQWHGSSRLAFNYQLSQSESLRINYSETERSPSILDEYWNTALRMDDGFLLSQFVQSNGNIETEKMFAWEIGYALDYRPANLFLDVKLFSERGRNLIGYAFDRSIEEILVQDGTEFVHNNDEFDIDGIEGQLIWRPKPGSMFAINFLFSDSEKRREVLIPSQYRIQDNITAERIISILAAYPLPGGYTIGASFYHMTEVDWTWDGGDQPAYKRWDARISKSFKIDDHSAQLDLVAQSIGDEYIEYYDETIFKPRYYAKLAVKF